jgi:formamidopyrimidine-DNA glycosylase
MARRQPHPADIPARLRSRRVAALRRIGKFLFADLDGDLVWVTHLGMSGRMQIARAGEPEHPHTNVVVRTGATEIRMVDPRTFGFVAVLTPDEFAGSPLALLGPDALDALPPVRVMAAVLAGRTVAIKTLLLDQRFLAGIGNIYADEILHRAGIRPGRAAGTLELGEVKALRAAVRPVLRAGLQHGGTSLDDLAYLLPDGAAGDYLTRLRVYGRRDEPCRRCGTPIRRSVIGQRSSFWCPRCQT